MRKLLIRHSLFTCFFVLAISLISCGQQVETVKTSTEPIPFSDGSQGIFDLLTQNDVAEITITTAFSTFLENKRHVDYLKGKFAYHRSKDEVINLPVKLRLRGRYRRMKCQFPPLKLKFRKADLAEHNLNEFNELKLVTHCLDDEATSKELVTREYLTYRLFNILSENSFRAQLVNVTYRNTKGKPKKIKGYGILIEDADEVAHRMNGEITDEMGLPDSLFNQEQEALVALFQYMIGNTDWSTELNRNVELIKCEGKGVMPIPYDFDFCGLVSAPYAVPKAGIGQTTVRQRIFQGNSDDVEDLHEAIHVFTEKKEALMDEVKNFELLSKESRTDISGYLEEFYKTIESDHAVIENLFSKEPKE